MKSHCPLHRAQAFGGGAHVGRNAAARNTNAFSKLPFVLSLSKDLISEPLG
jgi:hypothetical protein